MKNGTNVEKIDIEKKLEYLELNLDKIPSNLKEFESLSFRAIENYDENKFKQYRYLDPKDIQILLSPTNRLNDLKEKYSKSAPIYSYLVPENEEDIARHTTFLNMLKNLNIANIEEIEEEQKKLNKGIPFKVKYPGNYLWQIYYSQVKDKYFMLVPTEDSNCSAFFYLLKKQLKKRKSPKIFVPISNVEYSSTYLKKSQHEDIENYLWLFTKDWPLVYEVYNKDDALSIQIVGETEVYEKIKTPYKIILSNKEEAEKFYKLLKAIFVLQTELPHYYNFRTNINEYGSIEFYYNDIKMEYTQLAKFIRDQYVELLDKNETIISEKERLAKKLENIKNESKELEKEYIAKEKQISTFLECRKTFFGKVKYFFKYSKSSKNKNSQEIEKENEKIEENNPKEEKAFSKGKLKNSYTIEELVEEYKKFEQKEIEITNLKMDINALKLKNKNLTKKIENAIMYIEEIDKHKKSIFEFWKYSNKDEVATLPEGEQEEVNVERKITKVFDYNEDLEKLGKEYDKRYRKELSNDELDSIYISTTDLIDVLNNIKCNKVKPKEIENSLKAIKEELKADSSKEDVDIFGGILDDNRKEKTIANQKHREISRDKFNILELNKMTKQLGYKMSLEKIVQSINEILQNNKIEEEMYIYMIASKNELNKDIYNIFNINPEQEINKILYNKEKEFNLYKINIKNGINAIMFTNIIYYNNKNRTLPEGMNLSTNMLVDLSNIELKLEKNTSFNIVSFEDKNDELSLFDVKNINVYEYDIK